MGAGPAELLQLAAQLRTALPHQAPLRIAEMVQHCVVRLELLARSPGGDELHLEQRRHAEQLLELCRGYTTTDKRRDFLSDE